MKTNMKTMLALAGLLALGTTALVAQPQDNSGPQNDGPQSGAAPGGPPMRGHRPPVPAIVRALDVNHDGVIDSNEIANASAELKTLDKNGDGKLTPDEFMGPRPHMGTPRGKGANSGNRDLPPSDKNGAPSDDAPPGPPPDGQ
jgi:EF hand